MKFKILFILGFSFLVGACNPKNEKLIGKAARHTGGKANPEPGEKIPTCDEQWSNLSLVYRQGREVKYEEIRTMAVKEKVTTLSHSWVERVVHKNSKDSIQWSEAETTEIPQKSKMPPKESTFDRSTFLDLCAAGEGLEGTITLEGRPVGAKRLSKEKIKLVFQEQEFEVFHETYAVSSKSNQEKWELWIGASGDQEGLVFKSEKRWEKRVKSNATAYYLTKKELIALKEPPSDQNPESEEDFLFEAPEPPPALPDGV